MSPIRDAGNFVYCVFLWFTDTAKVWQFHHDKNLCFNVCCHPLKIGRKLNFERGFVIACSQSAKGLQCFNLLEMAHKKCYPPYYTIAKDLEISPIQ